MVSEDLQHVPIKLNCLSTARVIDSLLDEVLVLIGISRGITISSWQGRGCVNQLGEGSLADKTIFVGVSINKQLQERMVHLSMRMALLVLDSLLYKPDEIVLGLVEGVDGS